MRKTELVRVSKEMADLLRNVKQDNDLPSLVETSKLLARTWKEGRPNKRRWFRFKI